MGMGGLAMKPTLAKNISNAVNRTLAIGSSRHIPVIQDSTHRTVGIAWSGVLGDDELYSAEWFI